MFMKSTMFIPVRDIEKQNVIIRALNSTGMIGLMCCSSFAKLVRNSGDFVIESHTGKTSIGKERNIAFVRNSYLRWSSRTLESIQSSKYHRKGTE